MIMAITSLGYPGTITPGVPWARFQWGMGKRYWVYNSTMLQATPVTGGTRQVSLSSGYLGAYGVQDYVDTATTVTLPTVTTGTKYFMIVARRTWGTTNLTTLEVIDAGTTGNVTLPTRNTDYGNVDDQPLWMVPLAAGATVPGTPVDLRLLGTDTSSTLCTLGPVEVIKQYVSYVGFRLHDQTTGLDWVRETTGWRPYPSVATAIPLTTIATQTDVIVSESGWSGTVDAYTNKALRDGNTITLNLAVRRTGGGAITCDANGNFVDTTVLTVKAPWLPDAVTPFSFIYYGGSVSTSFGTVSGVGRLFPGGTFEIISGTPNYNLNVRGADLNPSLVASLTFVQPS